MANSPNTYSFLSVQATIVGPGGAIQIGSSAGVAEEGITLEPVGDKNTMKFGADGAIMHELNAATPGRAVVRLLKTSPINFNLSAMYNLQRLSPANWGQNTITVTDVNRGDVGSLTTSAFKKQPGVTWSKAGPMNEWEFDGSLDMLLGAGVANINSVTGT